MSNDQNWKPCPQGTLSEVKATQKRSNESPVMARRAALGLLLTAGAATGVAVTQSGSAPEVRKLTCSTARGLLPQYLEGELHANDLASLENHLTYCSMCQGKLDMLRKEYQA